MKDQEFDWCEEHQCLCDLLIEGDGDDIFPEPDRYECPECHQEDMEDLTRGVYQ